MIEIHTQIVLVALKELLGKDGARAHSVLCELKTVALLISLSNHVETIFVAEVVEIGIVGIVTGAHGIDIQLFHHGEVLNHTLATDHISTVGIHLVTVDSFNINWLPIHEESVTHDLHLAESHALSDILHPSFVGFYLLPTYFLHSRRSLHFCHEGVEIGCLGSPSLTVGEPHLGVKTSGCSNNLAVGVDELVIDNGITCGFSSDFQNTIPVIICQVGCYTNVVDMHLFVAAIEIAVASNA